MPPRKRKPESRNTERTHLAAPDWPPDASMKKMAGWLIATIAGFTVFAAKLWKLFRETLVPTKVEEFEQKTQDRRHKQAE